MSLLKHSSGCFTKHLIIGAVHMTLGLKKEEAEQCLPRTQGSLADSIEYQEGSKPPKVLLDVQTSKCPNVLHIRLTAINEGESAKDTAHQSNKK